MSGVSFTTNSDSFICRPIPRTPAGRSPVVYCNSASASPLEAIGNTANGPSLVKITTALAREGHSVYGPDLNATWGAQPALLGAGVYVAQVVDGLTAPPILVASSHGFVCALSYALAYPVRAIVGLIPAVDLTYLYANDVLGQQASIAAAWGVTPPAALPAGADPSKRTAELQGIPMRMYVASDDAVSTGAPAFAAAVGAEVVNLGPLGHTAAALAAVNPAGLVAWLDDALSSAP